MRILVISSNFYPRIGGVEAVIENIFSTDVFIKSKNEVRILSSKDIKNKYNIFNLIDKEFYYKGLIVKKIWMELPRSFIGFLIFPIKFLIAFKGYKEYLDDFSPDIINYHFPDDSSIYLVLYLLFKKKKIVLNFHGNDIQVFRSRFFYKFFIDYLANRALKIIFNSKYMLAEGAKVYPNLMQKAVIIENGVNLEFYNKIKPKKYFKNDYIFYIGRIVPKKGIDILIKAYAKLNIEGLNLLIEGKGELLNSMKSLSAELKLTRKIAFTEGRLSNTEKVAYMKGAVFCVMPSRVEPFGIVALEYMASKSALVSTQVGGLSDFIKDNYNALVVKADDINDLADKMLKLYSDKNLITKLKKNSYDTVRDYDWKILAVKYEKIFKELV